MSVPARILVSLIVVGGALASPCMAAGDLQTLVDAHIRYVNGGVGTEDADAMRAQAPAYPLELVFTRHVAERDEFLADVNLLIEDGRGHIVVERAGQGPIFLAQLPDGQYKITAEYRGQTQTRRVVIASGRHERLSLVWS